MSELVFTGGDYNRGRDLTVTINSVSCLVVFMESHSWGGIIRDGGLFLAVSISDSLLLLSHPLGDCRVQREFHRFHLQR